MPELDGFALAEMIREHPRFQRTAIIFISGVHLSEADTIKGYRQGAVDYISVPVVPEVLRAKVSVFTELHRKTRLLERLNNDLERRVDERTEALRQSEARIRTLNRQLEERLAELETVMQVLPVGIAVSTNLRLSHVVTNQAFRDLIGEPQPAAQRPETTSNDTSSPFRFMYSAMHSGRPVMDADMRLAGPNEEVKHILASAIPLLDASGAVRGSVGAFVDVTQRKQLEETLRQRAELLELASEAIVVRDMQGSIRYWNAGAEIAYGWSKEEALGHNMHELLRTVSPIPREEIDQLLHSEGSWRGNLKQRTRDGQEIVVASRKAFDSSTNTVLEINRDITGQLRAEDALRRTEKLAAMGRMAGIIAHEINNPLEAVTNIFYILRTHPSLNKEGQHFAALAEQELQRAAHITRQTLSFYRESNQPIAVSLIEVIDNVLELHHRAMQTGGTMLEKRYLYDGVVYGFPGELRQVFLNLISNAIQAMPSGGTLRIRISKASAGAIRRGLSVSIIDTGTGVSEVDARKLFQPFFSTKSTKGTGLGLWISRGIVQKYEGSITFRTFRGRNGNVTCFRVFLPTEEARHSKASYTEDEGLHMAKL
jgi:PAS domain S-box-containing protein